MDSYRGSCSNQRGSNYHNLSFVRLRKSSNYSRSYKRLQGLAVGNTSPVTRG